MEPDDVTFHAVTLEPDTPPPEDISPESVDVDDFRTTPVSLPEREKRRKTKLQKALQDLYVAVGTGVFPFDQQLGTVIVQQAEECARALTELSATSPTIRRALEALIETSAWGTVIIAHMPILVMIATKYVPAVRDNYSHVMTAWNQNPDTA